MYSYGLYIALMINGEQHEAVPYVYDTLEQCEMVREGYLKEKDLLIESSCFKGIFKEIK